ncbi:MAG: hypothetical protein KJN64_07770 [Ignavibacteria bacterium]|nr:hypothetical protein [Ignavibacteria bacterium]MBT8382919.1 hypothetical protein [Ignavibacteria bacterium]MBT8392553.1 hypothetical protein [Ignavibacteria bacterium]NNJ52365.1 hypothetical protein [Ignavibacteriaceae bacterium]NNL20482.1 hypothetical protein [Ignavibacteriaceae bacterium]
MKTKIILSVLCLLFISGAFTEGCEEEDLSPNYINVNVTVVARVVEGDLNSPEECTAICKNRAIKVFVQKAQGEFQEEIGVTDDACTFNPTRTFSFQLYKEQRIDAKVYVENVPPGYEHIAGSQRLEWSEVTRYKEMGETYFWTTYVDAHLKPNPN